MTGKDVKTQQDTDSNATARPGMVSRRSLLKTTAVGMPAMLTLHSGAALARSSNIIGVAPAGTRDAEGNAICLDTTYADPLSSGAQYDLGEPVQAHANVMSDMEYYPESNRSKPPVSADYVCQQGGPFYYHLDGWQQVNLPPNGAIVSTTAMVSVALRGTVNFNRVS